jgi:hypothetical protein
VQLSQPKELQNLLWLWGKLVDTSNSDNESNLWLSFAQKFTLGLGGSSSINECSVSGGVLFEVLLGSSGSSLS